MPLAADPKPLRDCAAQPLRARASHTPFATPSIALLLATAMSWSAHAATPTRVAGVSACLPAQAEAALLERETRGLGRQHAQAHARSRAQQCEAERGVRAVPGKRLSVSPQQALQDEERIRRAAARRAGDTTVSSTETFSAAVMAAADTASTQGRWSDPFVIPVVGVTSVLLHTGKVLFWSYDPATYHDPNNSTTGVAYLWDPATRTGRSITPPENIWCAGQTVLADGKVFIAGGNLRYPDPSKTDGTGGWMGTLTTYTFDPITETFTRQPDMQRGRWYPTTTKLADGRVVITSGIDETGTSAITNVVELFTPNPAGGVGTLGPVGPLHNASGLYPFQFVLPSSRMLEAGPGAYSSFLLDPAAGFNWFALPKMLTDHHYTGNAISFTDATAGNKQLIMVAGGHDETVPKSANEWIDGNFPEAGWQPFPLWNLPRHNANTVILPDGALLTVGGNRGLYGYDEPVFEAELYNRIATDTTGSWMTMAPQVLQAGYHSTALLLPDATVLMSQDDLDVAAAVAGQHKVQVYSPPYLFKGTQPSITRWPAGIFYGGNFDVWTDRKIASAMLIAPAATTHGNDMHQRAIKLKVRAREGRATLTAPSGAAIAPPGHYMLFVVDANGIPSVAKFVQLQ